MLKAGSRLALNTLPEPVTNWLASLTEDIIAIGAVILAVSNPALLVACLAVVVVVGAVALLFLWKFVRALFTKIASLFTRRERQRTPLPADSGSAS